MKTKELIEAVKNERGSVFQNCNDCEYGIHNGEVIEKLNRLAELEDKLENGTLIEVDNTLIGQFVIGIHKHTNGTYSLDLDENLVIGFADNGIVTWNDSHGFNDWFSNGLHFIADEQGKAEAEAKLKELKGE